MEKIAPRSETAIVVAMAKGDKDGGCPATAISARLSCKFSRNSDNGTVEWVRGEPVVLQPIRKKAGALAPAFDDRFGTSA
jgi:hypothetical protein